MGGWGGWGGRGVDSSFINELEMDIELDETCKT